MTDSTQEIEIRFTRAEREALVEGLAYITGYYGPPPDPPTPAFTALAKLEHSLAVPA